MEFKKANWEEWGREYFVAKMAFGIQLTVVKSEDAWLWQMGNLSFVFKLGKSKNEAMAKVMAEEAFQLYVEENLEKCTE